MADTPATGNSGSRDWAGADLTDSDFEFEDLSGANFKGSILKDANFYHANLEGANLQDADLRGANFRDANMLGANLDNARIDGTHFDGAIFDNWTLVRFKERRALSTSINVFQRVRFRGTQLFKLLRFKMRFAVKKKKLS